MENTENAVQTLPAIHVSWDALSQSVDVQLNPQEFKTYEFVLALLDMAKERVQSLRKMAQINQMQQQAVQAAQAQQLAHRIKHGR